MRGPLGSTVQCHGSRRRRRSLESPQFCCSLSFRIAAVITHLEINVRRSRVKAVSSWTWPHPGQPARLGMRPLRRAAVTSRQPLVPATSRCALSPTAAAAASSTAWAVAMVAMVSWRWMSPARFFGCDAGAQHRGRMLKHLLGQLAVQRSGHGGLLSACHESTPLALDPASPKCPPGVRDAASVGADDAH